MSAMARLLVVGGKDAPELASLLPSLPSSVEIVAIGKTEAEWDLSPEQWAGIQVMLNCGVGANAAKKQEIEVANHLPSCMLMPDLPTIP